MSSTPSRSPASPSPSLEIHGYVACPFAWRVRLAAAELGLAADFIPCDVDAPDPRAAAHNPDEHSPLLFDDGFVLLESEIIVNYLDDAYGAAQPLWPADPRQRAELRLLGTRLGSLDVHTEPSKPVALRKADLGLRLLEAVLEGRPFLHGARPGALDVAWWPFLANLYTRGLIDAERFPHVADSFRRAAARPSFQNSRPPWAARIG